MREDRRRRGQRNEGTREQEGSINEGVSRKERRGGGEKMRREGKKKRKAKGGEKED